MPKQFRYYCLYALGNFRDRSNRKAREQDPFIVAQSGPNNSTYKLSRLGWSVPSSVGDASDPSGMRYLSRFPQFADGYEVMRLKDSETGALLPVIVKMSQSPRPDAEIIITSKQSPHETCEGGPGDRILHGIQVVTPGNGAEAYIHAQFIPTPNEPVSGGLVTLNGHRPPERARTLQQIHIQKSTGRDHVSTHLWMANGDTVRVTQDDVCVTLEMEGGRLICSEDFY